jgi:hypothetical protein
MAVRRADVAPRIMAAAHTGQSPPIGECEAPTNVPVTAPLSAGRRERTNLTFPRSGDPEIYGSRTCRNARGAAVVSIPHEPAVKPDELWRRVIGSSAVPLVPQPSCAQARRRTCAEDALDLPSSLPGQPAPETCSIVRHPLERTGGPAVAWRERTVAATTRDSPRAPTGTSGTRLAPRYTRAPFVAHLTARSSSSAVHTLGKTPLRFRGAAGDEFDGHESALLSLAQWRQRRQKAHVAS